MNDLKFKNWATDYGRKKLADKLGVSLWSVSQYTRGLQTPRVPILKNILKLSKGAFTLEELVLECSRNK